MKFPKTCYSQHSFRRPRLVFDLWSTCLTPPRSRQQVTVSWRVGLVESGSNRCKSTSHLTCMMFCLATPNVRCFAAASEQLETDVDVFVSAVHSRLLRRWWAHPSKAAGSADSWTTLCKLSSESIRSLVVVVTSEIETSKQYITTNEQIL